MSRCVLLIRKQKTSNVSKIYYKGLFLKNTVYLKRGVPYFCIYEHNHKTCQKIITKITAKEKAPFTRGRLIPARQYT